MDLNGFYLEKPARIEAQHDLKILSKPKTIPNSMTDNRYSNYMNMKYRTE
jgi:hypothetical protein